MNSASYAIQIIPDLTIDDKYSAIISEAQQRLVSFTHNALKGNRLGELFHLDRSNLDQAEAVDILTAAGQFVVGFQFSTRGEVAEDNFRLYVKKKLEEDGRVCKFYLTRPVQEIMLQLISLEDRRTIAIFSMLNSSIDVGYRILTTVYAMQLKRILEQVPEFVRQGVTTKVEKLTFARTKADGELWKEDEGLSTLVSGKPKGDRPGSQDNILQVMADDSIFAEINQYVGSVISRSERIREKMMQIQQNPDIPRSQMHEMMVKEDLDQLENCYARIHIYLKAFYKNKDKRITRQNRVLRQFFGDQIEKTMAETGLLEDLLALSEVDYFKNIARHGELFQL